MALDLSLFTQALKTLDEALNAYDQEPQNTFIRDACIQRFEYSYDMSHKTLRRYLEISEASSLKELDFSSLIRLGYERGLISAELARWKEFRNARNITNHTYDEGKAQEVFFHIPAFLEEAKYLLAQIDARQKTMS